MEQHLSLFRTPTLVSIFILTLISLNCQDVSRGNSKKDAASEDNPNLGWDACRGGGLLGARARSPLLPLPALNRSL